MKCWFWHDWEKWDKPFSVDVVGKPNPCGIRARDLYRRQRKICMQERVCARCGKYQRKVRQDKG